MKYFYFSKGNIALLSLHLMLIIGLISLNFIPAKKSTAFSVTMNTFLLIAFFSAIFIYVLNRTDLIVYKNYIWEFPFNKFMTATLYLFITFIYLHLISTVWLKIISKQKYFIKSSLFTLLNCIVIVGLCFAYVTFVNESSNDDKKYDHAVVLGAAVWSSNKPSPIFIGRIEKARELLNNKKIKSIILTGGKAPGELTEAEAALKYLKQKKVETSKILIENVTSTTIEQVKFIKQNYDKKNKKIAFISDEFHLRRVKEICNFYDLKADIIKSDFKQEFKDLLFYKFRESIAILLFLIYGV